MYLSILPLVFLWVDISWVSEIGLSVLVFCISYILIVQEVGLAVNSSYG